MAKTKPPVHYWESFEKDTLHEGEIVKLASGKSVTVKEVLDCGRSCKRRFWWFL